MLLPSYECDHVTITLAKPWPRGVRICLGVQKALGFKISKNSQLFSGENASTGKDGHGGMELHRGLLHTVSGNLGIIASLLLGFLFCSRPSLLNTPMKLSIIGTLRTIRLFSMYDDFVLSMTF